MRLQARDLLGFGRGIDREKTIGAGGKRRLRRLGEAVDPDHGLRAGGDRGEPAPVRFHQPLLHIAALDSGERPAHCLDPGELRARFAGQRLDLGRHHRRPVEQVVVLEEIGLVGQDLLQPQAPLLVPGPRQAERLVPGRQLHRPSARPLRQHHGERFEQNAIDVVLRLLLRQAERVDLHAVTKAAQRSDRRRHSAPP